MLELRKQVDELQARVDEMRGVLVWGKYKGWREPAVGDRVRFSGMGDSLLTEAHVSEVGDNGSVRCGLVWFSASGVDECVLVFKGEPQPVQREVPLSDFVGPRGGA